MTNSRKEEFNRTDDFRANGFTIEAQDLYERRRSSIHQFAWIQNGTIQDNILFGLSMDKQRYKEVIKNCCLEKDLEMMKFGDHTEIGERGINLSGGEKQRIQLARAVYQDCDIYLLDDVFSAVYAHTGSEIFKECVRGALKNKTILLITHQVDFLHNVDLILVMRDGRIVQSGKFYPHSPENRYAIVDVSNPLVPAGFIREESNVIVRQLLRNRRPFVATIIDGLGNELFRVRRPIWWITSSIYAEVGGKVALLKTGWFLLKGLNSLSTYPQNPNG